MAFTFQKTIRRFRYGEPIVVVSGLPRSGTSMAMRMLKAGGVPIVVDGVREADEDNPRGYFELERVKDLAKENDWSWLLEAKGKAIKIISYLLKELPANYNYKVVFMRRDLREVLASQAKMLDRRGEENSIDDEKMMELFESDLWKVSYLLKHNPQFDSMELLYSDVLRQPLEEARRLSAFLGGRIEPDKMAAAVDPTLYRNKAEELAS